MRGGLKGGAIVDALTSGAFSTWDNAKAVREGRESAHKLADASGFTDWAKRGLRGALNHFNRPLPRVFAISPSRTRTPGASLWTNCIRAIIIPSHSAHQARARLARPAAASFAEIPDSHGPTSPR